MPTFSSTPKIILRLLHLPPRIAYAVGLGPLIGRTILLLTTTGRKSGKPRVTPLQYEEIDGRIYLGAALGSKADWYRNIQANPVVQLHIKSHRYSGLVQTMTDPAQIADFLEVKLQRHPKMTTAILHGDGLEAPFTRADLENYAQRLTMVVINPEIMKRNP